MAATNEQYSRLQVPDNCAYDPATGMTPQGPQELEEQPEKSREKFKSALYCLGFAELVIGIVSVLMAVITIVVASNYRVYHYTYNYFDGETFQHTAQYYHDFTYTCQGIWGGIFILVSGILGIKAKSHPSVCMYSANMSLSILAAVVALAVLVMSVVAAVNNVSYYESQYRIKSLIAIHIVLAALACGGGVLCIVHSTYCCRGVCCRHHSYRGVVAYYAPPQGGQQAYQTVQMQNGQFVLVPYPPSSAPTAPVSGQPPMYQHVAYETPMVQVPLEADRYPAASHEMQTLPSPAQPV